MYACMSQHVYFLRHKIYFELAILHFLPTHLRDPVARRKEIKCFMQTEKLTNNEIVDTDMSDT